MMGGRGDSSSSSSSSTTTTQIPPRGGIFAGAEVVPESSGELPIYGIVSAVVLAIVAIWNTSDEEISSSADDYEDLTLGTNKKSPLNQCEVAFDSIRMTLNPQKKNQPERVILNGSIRAVAKPGRMLAIMGPSGSGKTSTMSAIAGRIKKNKRLKLSGMRYVNGVAVSGDAEVPSAFIEQEVNFFPHLTVRETLDFRVELKLGKLVSKSERDAMVEELMDMLSLTKSANTIVGDSKIRGVSGGERKRLSIACEMIDSPPVIFLDEPTSGLDSYQATQVVQTLKKLADSGKTIIASIHQPSQRAFSMFDDLLLVSEGRQMYFGEVNNVRSYFDAVGYPCPKEEGTAEHILDVVSSTNGYDGNNGGSFKTLHERLDFLAEKAAEQSEALDLGVIPDTSDSKKVQKLMSRFNTRHHGAPSTNAFCQFKRLLSRSLKEAFRGKGVILVKLIQQISLGVIYGGIYSLGNNQASIMDRIGLLNLIAVGSANMALAGTIRAFPKEKAIIAAEMNSKLYRTFPYFISKAISEIPLIAVLSSVFGAVIYPLVGLRKGGFQTFLGLTALHSVATQSVGLLLGSISKNSDMALALMPPIIVLSIIFDGRNISTENTPRLLRWLPKAGIVRWAYEGYAVNEFEGLEFTSSGPYRGPTLKTGKEALARFGLDGSSLLTVFKAEARVIAVCYVLSILGLTLTGDKFQVMKEPAKK
eukprot:CAMPEP_0195512664 /NCGR_PEP_ID=MMETSP0794_2-20130614/4548_1 /TAXON_ID=515487 /ORGANISM="Stephanopyxis turris, Strain CCMP 815" /LENGTH=700 /DNA_ID=CAMNT_0040640507 /DNA_START=237 /DNA_END=2339 /DNA_ORIENTATION=+